MPTRVKICCIASAAEARMAIRKGANALGLVSAMPSGPGVIPDEEIGRIASVIPPGVARVLLTSSQDVATIIEQQRRLQVDTLQLVDQLDDGAHAELRDALPGVRLIQVVHVTGPSVIEQALRHAETADALLLDSGNPELPAKELGGTGRTHDWAVSREIVERCTPPTFLAGGLDPDNVSEAIQRVRPYGVDVCSGVRSRDRLDPNKLDRFMRAVATT